MVYKCLLDGYYKVMSNIPKWDIYQPLIFSNHPEKFENWRYPNGTKIEHFFRTLYFPEIWRNLKIGGIPIAGCFIMEHPIKMDDFWDFLP